MGFLIPWGCLKDRDLTLNKKAMTGPRKTFAQSLGNTCSIPLSQLPTPCIKGDIVVVRVEEKSMFMDMTKNPVKPKNILLIMK